MANTVKIKRGQSANISSVALAEGELAVALDTGELYVGDGSSKKAIGKDYAPLANKPQINNVELVGNKTLDELGIQEKGDYVVVETDPTVPSHVKSITEQNITNWNNKQDTLTAGENITIENNIISAIASGDVSADNVLIYNFTSRSCGNITFDTYNEFYAHMIQNYYEEKIIFMVEKINLAVPSNSNVIFIPLENYKLTNNSSGVFKLVARYWYNSTDGYVQFTVTVRTANYTITDDVVTCKSFSGTSTNSYASARYESAYKPGALSTVNTIAFTPTANYHPSTKLYTDKTHYENMTGYDASKTQVLKNVQGVLTWVDEV